MLKIIEGSDLKGSVKDAEKSYFYGGIDRHTENEYLQLILDSQPYFKGLEDKSVQITDNYYIYAPDFYLKSGIATAIAVTTNDRTCGVNAKMLYVDNPITVKAIENGYVFAGNDGRHRYAVAQKYHLKILVDVVEESANETNEECGIRPDTVSITRNSFLNWIRHIFKRDIQL